MLIKAMVPQFWDVSLGAVFTPEADAVVVTRVAKPQACWAYRGGGWTQDALENIPEGIRRAAEALHGGD